MAISCLIAFLLLCFVAILAMNLLLVRDPTLGSAPSISSQELKPPSRGSLHSEITREGGLFHLDIFRRKIPD